MSAERSIHAPANVPVMTMAEQADWLLALWDRTFLADGTRAAETIVSLSGEDADTLHAIGCRMARIAPHERAVRALVVGE